MHYLDLGLLEPGLKQKALSLGYAATATPQKIAVKTQADLKKIPSKEVALVSGNNVELLKKAASREITGAVLVDAFAVPNFFKDDGLMRSVAQNSLEGKKIAFAIPYAYLLRASFVYRARFVGQTKLFLSKCLKRNAPFVIVSGAENEFELKSPREVLALAQLLGLSFLQAQKSLGSDAQKLLVK